MKMGDNINQSISHTIFLLASLVNNLAKEKPEWRNYFSFSGNDVTFNGETINLEKSHLTKTFELIENDVLEDRLNAEDIFNIIKIQLPQEKREKYPIIQEMLPLENFTLIKANVKGTPQAFKMKLNNQTPFDDINTYNNLKAEYGNVTFQTWQDYRQGKLVPTQEYIKILINNDVSLSAQEKYKAYKQNMELLAKYENYIENPSLLNAIQKYKDAMVQLSIHDPKSPLLEDELKLINQQFEKLEGSQPTNNKSLTKNDGHNIGGNNDEQYLKKTGSIDIFVLLATLIITGIIVAAALIFVQL